MEASGSGSSGKKKRKRNNKYLSKRHRIPRDVDKFLADTFNSLIPDDPQEMKRNEIIEKLRRLIKAKYRYSEVFVYGSYASGTALYWSDIDIGFKVRTQNSERTSYEIMDLLRNNGFDDVRVGSKDLNVNKKMEKVHFICGRERKSKLAIDCSLNNKLASTFSSSFVKAVADFDTSIRTFLVLIKQFAKCQDLNRSLYGTLPNIGHCYLGIFYMLQNNICPKFLQEDETHEVDLQKEAETYLSISENFSRPTNMTPVQNLLLGYFSYYSKTHNFTTMAISLRGPCLVRKVSLGWPEEEDGYFLGIIDPFSGDNIGAAVDAAGLIKIKAAFKTARQSVEKGHFQKLFRLFGK